MILSFQVSVVDGCTGEIYHQSRSKDFDINSIIFFNKTAELYRNILSNHKHAVLEIRSLVPEYVEKSLFV